MDCRQFRKQHALFIDDLLSGVHTWAMRDHLSGCASCSRLDSQLRRALIVARNAPMIRPSAQFQRKLAARLATERASHLTLVTAPRWGSATRAAVAGFAIVAGLAAAAVVVDAPGTTTAVATAPVAVTAPQLLEMIGAQATPATVVSNAPVHPAMLLAQRATEQFAATHARALHFQATH